MILNLIGSLFLNRLSEMGMTGAMSVVSEHGGYSDKVPATPEFVQLLNDSESTFYYPYLFAYSHICQYFTHAVFEFPVVKGYIDQTDKYFYGGATFGVFYKLIAKLAGLSSQMSGNIMRGRVFGRHSFFVGTWTFVGGVFF